MTLPSHGRHVLIRSWMLLWLNEDRNFHKRIPQLAVIVATHHFIAKQSHNQGTGPVVVVGSSFTSKGPPTFGIGDFCDLLSVLSFVAISLHSILEIV
jgi:hypothetical protein